MFILSVLLAAPAAAGSCDAQLASIDKLAPDAVAPAFAELIKCDRKLADSNFLRYLGRATDADAITALALVGIDGDVWNPVWGSLSKITSYEARDEVALKVGEACTTHPKVVNFLQGGYAALRDVEFQQWDDAFESCSAESLWTWMDGQIQSPPTTSFDEKYDTLLGIYVAKKGPDSLDALAGAAIKASAGGPFEALLARMGEAVAPKLGSQITPENQAKLEAAMVKVAQQVPTDKARDVASQLANSGAEAAAAQLLPKIYPDRVQSNGSFLYGVATLETGECDGKKNVVIHYATLTEPGKRWSILADIEPLLRASKGKLKGCTMESPWPVLHTPEPVKNDGDVEAWISTLKAEWEKNGAKVTLQKEKSLTLP